ncbi:uncharacterized protein LOC132561209 [Ylistrum balloti]|uniref:uncharacterized protein LOC132561209 n=1 Tax=Ylistrum balloti TaxID=509963 RepID=UPI002905BB5C|nr:uncharacterized protein LOC132561209 [Ylistrum balloti]
MAASRLASNLTEDYLTCSICCEIFRDPRQLSCDHSFCLACLLDYGQKCVVSGQLSCPICRCENLCPSGKDFHAWIRSFPSDILLVAILTTVQNHDQNSLTSPEESALLDKDSKKKDEKSFCIRHKSNVQDVYCFTHALLLCATCAWIDHDQCLKFPLDDCSEKITVIIQQLKFRFDQLSNRVTHVKDQGIRANHIIEQCKSKSQARLRDVQDVLQQFWGKAQLNVQHLAQSIHQRDNEVMNALSSISVIQDDLLHLTQDLGNANQTGSKMKALDLLQECERRATEHHQCLNNIEVRLGTSTPFNLDVNEDLLQFCANFRDVGNLSSSSSASVQADDTKDLESFLQVVPVPSANQGSDTGRQSEISHEFDVLERSSNPKPDSSVDSLSSTLVKATRPVKFTADDAESLSDVSIMSSASKLDSEESYVHGAGKRGSLASISSTALFESFSHRAVHVGENIRGIFTLSDVCIVGEHVVVVDQYNSLVMKFDVHSGVHMQKLSIMEPHHIALIPETHTIVITCWSHNEISTVEVEPSLKTTGEPLKTSKHYIGIYAYDRQRMLVSALDKSIDVINFQGHVIHSIRPRFQTLLPGILVGKCILFPADLCILSEDSILVFDGVRKSLVAVHFSGKTLWSKYIEGVSGFTVFEETVYVCNSKTNTITTLTRDGKIKDKNFLSKFVGIKRPWAIDVRKNVTVVTEDTPSGTFHIVVVDGEDRHC